MAMAAHKPTNTQGGTIEPATGRHRPRSHFSHEAMFYEGLGGFVAATAPFVAEGVAADEAVLVVVDPAKINALRDALGVAAQSVRFADMADVGTNPARIIPAWQDFTDEQLAAGRRFRGIGEPITPSRSAPALVECQLHESLLNRAFGWGPPWRLGCPYDLATLDPAVVAEAARSHPVLCEGGLARPSTSYAGPPGPAETFGAPLADPVPPVRSLEVDRSSLPGVRGLVAREAATAGMAPRRAHDVVLAVDELATNSVRHGGGGGRLLVWREAGSLVCEVRDAGRLDDPLVGRRRPAHDDERGRGLWMVQRLAQLVQIRSGPGGTTVRVYLALG